MNGKTPYLPRLPIILLTSLFAAVCLSFGCGGGRVTGGGEDIVVTAKILLPDGTEKELSETPLPLKSRIKLTFSSPVDSAEAEALLSLTVGGAEVPRSVLWNDDKTDATVKPNYPLDYQRTYTVSVAAGEISGTSLQADGTKTAVEAFSNTLTTMVKGDVNGDGKADPFLTAMYWEGGNQTGRSYLFYGNNMASGGAGSADAVVTGEQAGSLMMGFLPCDFNDDGYADPLSASQVYNGIRGRVYLFSGGAGEAPLTGALGAASANFIIEGGADNDMLSFNFLILPDVPTDDVNDDGYSDFLAASSCDSERGCGYLFFGPNLSSGSANSANVIVTGENQGDHFFFYQAGDVNGDGIADIVAGAWGYNGNTGRVYLFFGRSDLSNMGAGSAGVILDGESAGDEISVMLMADLNGDGIKDIVVTSDAYESNKGRVYIFYGGSGLASKNAAQADVILTGEAAGGSFGVQGLAGDVTGDGVADLLVGARNYNSDTGRVYVFAGGSGLSSKGADEADYRFTGENAGDQIGLRGVGDVNGDGLSDIFLGSMYYPSPNLRGRGYLFFGGSSLASKGAGEANVIITGEQDGDMLGLGLGIGSLVDVNGDGALDIVTGAPAHNSLAGRVYLFYGGSGITNKGAADADVILDGENANDALLIY